MAELGRVDAIVFTGGIGENSRLVRRLIAGGLEEFGIVLDAAKNEANERVVSSGRVKIMVVPTNEELAIARDTKTDPVLTGRRGDGRRRPPRSRPAGRLHGPTTWPSSSSSGPRTARR